METDLPDSPVMSLCDRRLFSQALTNLVKNATEAIEAQKEHASGGEFKGHVLARLKTGSGRFTIEVIDNGAGLPKEGRNRLVEPYMTTRAKGTGLGLAIVQKITEQHGGTIQLRDAPKRKGQAGGACIRLDFPILSQTADSAAAAGSDGSGEDSAGTRDGAGKKRKQRKKSAVSGKQEATHGI
jgi:two-component system nitrogen regulation sensor histidine kinase NtrY